MNKIKAKIQQTQETIKLSGIYHNYIYHDETLDGHGTAQDKLRISDTAQEKINQAIEYGQEIKTYSERIAHVETQSAEALEKAESATEVAEHAEQEIQTYDGRITEAQTNASQALAQVGNKQDRLTPGTNITIENNVISASGNVESVNTKTGVVVLTGDDISADVSELTDTVQGHLQTLHDNIKDIELFKFPNATIIGEPVIQNGQVSGFTANDYLQFPFKVDLHNQPFQIDFCFTTGDDVTTQQNVLDSQFGIALAIQNSKGLMAISHNGTSWAGSVTGTMTILPNTTYYARLSWNRINYQTQLSTDGTAYTPDMNFGSTQAPYPRTMFIGGCSGSAIGHTPHPFGGTINLNYAYLTVAGNVIWQGMDDAGLATRLASDVSNITEEGKERIKQIVGDSGSGGRNIGDIFYTTRTDTALAGAVECNGGTYSTADYTGTGSVGELLEAGKLDYISLTAYATAISTKGWCDKIGWDGTGTTSFRVPKLAPKRYVVKAQEPTAGNNSTWYRLYNDGWVEQGGYFNTPSADTTYTITIPCEMSSNNYTILITGTTGNNNAIITSVQTGIQKTSTSFGARLSHKNNNAGTPSITYWQVSGQSAIVSDPIERAMFQLFNSTTDEAVATCTSVLTDVAGLKDMSNITAIGKETIAHQAMPSSRYIDLTLGASDTTYTAPADGYFLLYAEYASGSNTAYDIYNTTTAFGFRHWFGANNVNASGRGFVPVKKDDVVLIHINGVLKNVDFKFIYAEGAQ